MSLSALHCCSLTWSSGCTSGHHRTSSMGPSPEEGTTTERSEVQSFIGIDYLLRLGPSHIPHPVVRDTAHMELGPHDILAHHAEPGSCCRLVFHLTAYKPASHCPRKGPEPAGGTGSPCQGSALIRAWPFCFVRQRRIFSAAQPPSQCLCLPVTMASNYLL